MLRMSPTRLTKNEQTKPAIAMPFHRCGWYWDCMAMVCCWYAPVGGMEYGVCAAVCGCCA